LGGADLGVRRSMMLLAVLDAYLGRKAGVLL